jgi:hypothetical protein
MDPLKLLRAIPSDRYKVETLRGWRLERVGDFQFCDLLGTFTSPSYMVSAARILIDALPETTAAVMLICAADCHSDSYTAELVRVISAKITEPFSVPVVVGVMSTVTNDSYKIDVLTLLVDCMVPIDSAPFIGNVVGAMRNDSYRVQAVLLLSHRLDPALTISGSQAKEILGHFANDSYKIEALRSLRPWIGDDAGNEVIMHAFRQSYLIEATKILAGSVSRPRPPVVSNKASGLGATLSVSAGAIGAEQETISRNNCSNDNNHDEEIRELREEVARAKEERAIALAMKASLEDQIASRPVAIEDAGGGEAAQESPKCVVCMDAEKCVLPNACNHISLCEECARTLLRNGVVSCPICRVESAGWRKVYV